MIRKNIYRWHRTISIIIALPVLLWAASGFMHPLMTSIRPKITTQTLTPVVIDSSRIKLPLEKVLQMNRVDSFISFRIVSIGANWFYQVQLKQDTEPLYFATLTGKTLAAGNWIYAQHLARIFLEGQTGVMQPTTAITNTHDCCDAATDLVLNQPKGARINHADLIKQFDGEYKYISRFLPVYRVSFDRPDGIRIYVDPTTDKFALAVDDRRAAFDRFFSLVHTWGWLEFLGKGKLVVEFLLVSLAFLTTLMGIYIFFNTRSKKIAGNKVSISRRWHRFTAITVSLFTLMFTFSGAYHALSKLATDPRGQSIVTYYHTNNLLMDIAKLQAIVPKPITGISLSNINSKNYWRLQTAAKDQPAAQTDLMKTKQVAAAEITYIAVDDNSILPNGDRQYAIWLATQFSGNAASQIIAATAVTKFYSEYNFADKRLPAWKIAYANREMFFVETATATLAKRTSPAGLAQDFSFGFLHKHEFLGWAGKGWRDFSTMFWAFGQILMVGIGMGLYWKLRKPTIKKPL